MECTRLTYQKNEALLKVVQSKTPFFLSAGEDKKPYRTKKRLNAFKNKYNGKELEQALGLNLYEMDFRLYDQTLGRFMVVDPLAEINGQVSFSPYAFAHNNPISLSDPSGLCPDCDDGYAGSDGYETDGYERVRNEDAWNYQRRNEYYYVEREGGVRPSGIDLDGIDRDGRPDFMDYYEDDRDGEQDRCTSCTDERVRRVASELDRQVPGDNLKRFYDAISRGNRAVHVTLEKNNKWADIKISGPENKVMIPIMRVDLTKPGLTSDEKWDKIIDEASKNGAKRGFLMKLGLRATGRATFGLLFSDGQLSTSDQTQNSPSYKREQLRGDIINYYSSYSW